MQPVGFGAVKETVSRIFTKAAFKSACFSLHIHTSVRENKAKEVSEDIHNRNPLDFSGIAEKKKLTDLEFFKKFRSRIQNFISVFGIMWYT